MPVSDAVVRRVCLLLFVLSGFAGLIYESIWAHYLKLFLGHAAQAQTLVLTIFMGGMAVGAWLAGRASRHCARPWLVYVWMELLIGLLGLAFHPLFVALTEWSFTRVIPQLGAAWAVEAWKWSLAGLLILPQSILLGATFPFVSAGLLRRVRRQPGRLIAGLYFANSLGAAVGILVAGFVLIGRVGLPGTLMAAAAINLALALLVWLLLRLDRQPLQPALQPAAAAGGRHAPLPVGALLAVALLTGMASFIYEIGWIRMLALVLGSSVHAFELMLSAFITGLAIGGLWVRRHVDHFAHPLRALALIQLAMGALAILTLPAYGHTFQAMAHALQALRENEAGYVFFNLFSHGLALLVMLPATVLAGMTLPILTHLLLTRGDGEAAIGRVYALNTVGAIAGVVLAVQWLMPLLGLKGVILVGGGIDMALGLWLLRLDRPGWPLFGRRALAVATAAFVLLITTTVTLDRGKMASGVYREGELLSAGDAVIFHHDGRTASVDVVRHADSLTIRTNGKPDAAVALAADAVSPDESTMTLLAALPLLVHPHMREAAVIGLGAGMSSHTLLLAPSLARVDTVEIEPGMVAGARLLGDKVERTFSDPRSALHIADAKTFFTRRQQRYDLILSEPSNPWVSGVAGLFSVEFYRQTRRYLNDDGLFAQWLHLYEMDMPLVASVAKALATVFPHYRLYGTGAGDVLFLASARPLPEARWSAAGDVALRQALERVGIAGQTDVDWLVIGGSAYLQPLFDSYPVPANSDFFPYLERQAVRARYLNRDALDLLDLGVRVMAAIDPAYPQAAGALQAAHPLPSAQAAVQALWLRAYWRMLQYAEALPPPMPWPADLVALLQAARQGQDCNRFVGHAVWLPAVLGLAEAVQPHWSPSALQDLWRSLADNPCLPYWPEAYAQWLDFLQAVARRDDAAVPALAWPLFEAADGGLADTAANRLLLHAVLVAHVRRGEFAAVLPLWERYARRHEPPLDLRALMAYALARLRADGP